MATISTADFKNGLGLKINDKYYTIVEFQHVKPGKGGAFVRYKIRDLRSGRVIDQTCNAGTKFENVLLLTKEMQYLYDDGEACQFMDTDSYEQIAINDEDVGEAKKWMLDGMMVNIMFYNGKAIGVDVPQVVELKIVETAPNFRGDTQGSNKKPATLETGAVVQIPFHVLEGEVIRVDTVRGEYIERANK